MLSAWKAFLLSAVGLRLRKINNASKVSDRHGQDYGFDNVVSVRGFGVIVSGWQLKSRRPISRAWLTVGDKTIEADHRYIITLARTDLSEPHNSDADVKTAGFRLIFLGNIKLDTTTEKVRVRIFSEDSEPIEMKVPSSLPFNKDADSAIELLLKLYPSFAREQFIDRFNQAFHGAIKRRAKNIKALIIEESKQAVLLALPEHRDDVFLAFAELLLLERHLPREVGIAFIKNAHHSRGIVLDRIQILQARANRPISLFEVNSSAHVLWSLGSIFSRLHTDRFWFGGPDSIPTERGWAQAASYFAGRRDGLELFLSPDAGRGTAPDSLSFAWSVDAFRAWIATAPCFFSGFYRDNRLPVQEARHPKTIRLMRSRGPLSYVEKADERVYQSLTHRQEPTHEV